MEPLGIHHASINVSDPEAALAFYTDVLGGTARDDRPDRFGVGGAWIDLGAAQVHLIEALVPDNLGQHFAVQVADLDATVAELRAKGGRGERSEPGRHRPSGVPERPVRQRRRAPRGRRLMSIVGRALGRLVPLLAGFLASVAVSMALASGITALDIDGAPSVVLAVALWCTAIGTAAKLLYAR